MFSLEETHTAPSLPEQIIDELRHELQEYGALLNLFDEQQEAILNRKPDLVLEVEGRITAQLGEVRARRMHRETMVSTLANTAEKPTHPTLLQAIPLFRQPMRPMVEALALEINRLITRTRRRAQQNQMLLARTIEVAQDLLGKLSPGTVTRTYSPKGNIKIKTAVGSSRLLEHS